MKKIIFECEVITPMFLAGADGKTPELRVPSIKGAIRFWWRAMNGHLPVKDLRKKEAEIFGGSGDNEGRSKVIIRISHGNIISNKYQPLPHRQKSFKNLAINPEFNFTVELSFYENNDITKEQLKNLFILTSLLGGLGKRARRGFGSFKINKIDDVDFNVNIDLISYIAELLNSVNCDNKHFQVNDGIKSDFKLKHFPYIKEIKVGKKENSYDELLRKIGESSHSNNSDYTGYAKGRIRFASPVYVSVIAHKNKCLPIVTVLEPIADSLTGKNKSEDFIRGVLS